MRLLHLAFILPVLFTLQTNAQTCGFIPYNSDNGLAANNYMGIFQDSHGILWVGSYGCGVSRFDGKHWTCWTTANGLFNNTATNIFEDKEGGIWFDHNELGVSRWHDGKWQQFDFKKDTNAVGQLLFDRRQKKILIIEMGWQNKKETRVFEYDYDTRNFKSTGKVVMPGALVSLYTNFDILQGKEENEWWVSAANATRRFIDHYHVYDGQALKLPALPDSYELGPRPVYSNAVLSPEAGAAIMQHKKGIYLLKNDQWIALPPPEIPRYTPDGNLPALQFAGCSFDPASNSLFAVWQLQENAFMKRYLLAEYDAANIRLRQSLLFSNSFFGKVDYRQIRKDIAGTLWLATTGNVLRLFPDKFYIPVNSAGLPPDPWGVAQAGNGSIWFASSSSGLAGFDGLSLKPPPKGLESYKSFNDGSLTDKDGNVYFNNVNSPEHGILKFDGINRWEYLEGTKSVIGFFLGRDKKGQILWGTSQQGMWILRKGQTGATASNWQKINKGKGLLLDNVLTCLQDRYGRYWMGRTSQGIAVYDLETDKVTNWLRNQSPKNYGAESMAEDQQGNLWFGTDRGLRFFDNRAAFDQNFELSENLLSVGVNLIGESTVRSCLMYDAHTLLVGNAAGLHLLDLDAFYEQPRRVLIRSLTLKNGYQAGPVGQNAVTIDRDSCIWLTAANGAFRYNPRALPRDSEIPQVFPALLIAGQDTFMNLSSPLALSSQQHYVQIFFKTPVNPMLYDNIRFEYRLTGDSNWVKILPTAESVTFPSLQAGDYLFEIRAVKEGLLSVPATVEFRISPVLWEIPLFWILVLATGLGIGAIWWRREVKIARQKLQISNQQLQLEKSINEMGSMLKERDKLQVQAIVNQLNPHFINNALQWLQVRVDEDEEAVRVVGKLSENISTVFKNSRMKRAYHSLREEMKLTENYLFIQKCRFGDKLSYQMPDEETLVKLEKICVPLMIVQIHAENAVEHGIRNKSTGGGRVNIRLEAVNDYAIITIEDDGVGREAAQKIGSKGTQNGTKMLQELQAIYNRQNEIPLEQWYEDGIFTTADGYPYGTRVIVRMPKDYNFEF